VVEENRYAFERHSGQQQFHRKRVKETMRDYTARKEKILRPPWARIAVRVAGSWIVATGLLLLGWAARRG
jgi:hypothetical protein